MGPEQSSLRSWEVGPIFGQPGDPYRPRTPEEKAEWGLMVKHALGAFLYLAEQTDTPQDEVDEAIAMLGFEDLYRLSLDG